MTHPDDEGLADAALGEGSPDTEAHLAGCQECRARVSGLRELERSLAAAGREPMVLEAPPTDLWPHVRAAALDPAPDRPVRAPRRRPLLVGAAVGLAGLVVGVVVGVVVTRASSDPATPAPETVASAVLSPLPGHTASGSARLLELAGHRSVRVHVAGTSADGGFVEAWLFEPGTTRMIALGMMTRSTQDFAVPRDVDLSVYRSVDISVEPLDGDPAHSTDSVAQGSLSR